MRTYGKCHSIIFFIKSILFNIPSNIFVTDYILKEELVLLPSSDNVTKHYKLVFMLHNDIP